MQAYQQLKLWPENFAVCKLPADAIIPDWYQDHSFGNITRTKEELSIVCEQQFVGKGVSASSDWKMLQVMAKMDFSLIGIVAGIACPLAEAGISIFTLSTFDTDYILIKNQQINHALSILSEKGYQISQSA